MKRFITFVSFLGVFSMFLACSSKTSSPEPYIEAEETSSSSVSKTKSSADTVTAPADTVFKDSTVNTDTVIHKQVYISSNSDDYVDPYFSSGIFCWAEGCEVNFSSEAESSSSSKKPSSANSGGITIDTPSEDPPTIEGDVMTDNRDGQKYNLETLAGKKWMTENLRYKTSSGFYCNAEIDGDTTNVCETYGTFYIYSAALRACPGGWRLPTKEEAEAVDKVVDHEWWSFSGRFKIEGDNITYGLKEDQGYIWIRADGEFNSWRVENYNDKKVHEPQGGSATERAYNVRCVEGDAE